MLVVEGKNGWESLAGVWTYLDWLDSNRNNYNWLLHCDTRAEHKYSISIYVLGEKIIHTLQFYEGGYIV